MESLTSFAQTMRATAMQSGQLSYLPKRSSIGRITLAAIVLGGIIIATASWYTLKNRKVRQQPLLRKPNVGADLRPLEPNYLKTEKVETLLTALKMMDPRLFLWSAATELKTALRALKDGKKTEAIYGSSKEVAQGYFERLKLLEGYHQNGFLHNPVPYSHKTGEISLKGQVKVVKKEHRNEVSNIFIAVSDARTTVDSLYTPDEEVLEKGLIFLSRADIYEAPEDIYQAPEDIYQAPEVPLHPPSQQSDAQRLADLVWPLDRPHTEEVQRLARKLLKSCPEKIEPGWGDRSHILQDGVQLYNYCGKVGDVRFALTLIAEGKRLNSDRQVGYIRDFDKLMIELQTAAAKVRKEEEKCQEVKKKLNDFLNKWRENMSHTAKLALGEIIKHFEAGATPRLWKEAGSALNDFLEKSPNHPYSLDNKEIA